MVQSHLLQSYRVLELGGLHLFHSSGILSVCSLCSSVQQLVYMIIMEFWNFPGILYVWHLSFVFWTGHWNHVSYSRGVFLKKIIFIYFLLLTFSYFLITMLMWSYGSNNQYCDNVDGSSNDHADIKVIILTVEIIKVAIIRIVIEVITLLQSFTVFENPFKCRPACLVYLCAPSLSFKLCFLSFRLTRFLFTILFIQLCIFFPCVTTHFPPYFHPLLEVSNIACTFHSQWV